VEWHLTMKRLAARTRTLVDQSRALRDTSRELKTQSLVRVSKQNWRAMGKLAIRSRTRNKLSPPT
jgi:hypothetical protein